MDRCHTIGTLDPRAFEPSWPFRAADVYIEMDLGEDQENQPRSTLRRPWYKLNQQRPERTELRLFRRPYFHLAED